MSEQEPMLRGQPERETVPFDTEWERDQDVIMRMLKADPATATIVLHPDQPAGVMRESHLHEALHAVTALTGVASDLGDDLDERLVRRLAPALLDLIRLNPDAVDYWAAR